MATWQDRFFELMARAEFDTLKDVAAAAGLSQSTLHTAVKKEGKMPKKITLDKIASAINTTSQYLMFGSQESALPVYSMPVLDRDHIGAWIDKRLQMEDCIDIIVSPFMISDGFAWYVDTPDMEPVINRGDLAFCEPGFDMEAWDYSNPVFVLNAATRSTKTSGAQVIFQQGNKPATDYLRISFCEICMASGELSFLYHNPQYPSLLPSEPRVPIATIRHIVRRF